MLPSTLRNDPFKLGIKEKRDLMLSLYWSRFVIEILITSRVVIVAILELLKLRIVVG